MKQWTKLTLSRETVEIITDNYAMIGTAQKIHIEEAVAQVSGVKMF